MNIPLGMKASILQVLAALEEAVAVRCAFIDNCSSQLTSEGSVTAAADMPASLQPARMLILFSGGVDSTLMAALADRHLPPHEPIDLASVCFAGGVSPDRLAALDALQVVLHRSLLEYADIYGLLGLQGVTAIHAC